MDTKKRTEKGFLLFFQTIPWLWHVALGTISYLVLHFLAERKFPLPDQTPEEVALYAHRLIWEKAALIFQYLTPSVFGLLAIASFRRSREKGKGQPRNE